ncbi:hypothetical protein GGE07_001579 [Sinorhizobium terangae]|uniref:Uncharacterized protein n=1 Tax=Sinorhizobium terangae TaxID=110322 RepID=A0A6N7LKI3_SINTE|nr:hypothetical protein [Sinorhizobium terangae]MBB4184950.1 hypothetical protein [Sinorhizobium terangae]MQX18371.1 hypothetical protein [Sinorhizobium terangae]
MAIGVSSPLSSVRPLDRLSAGPTAMVVGPTGQSEAAGKADTFSSSRFSRKKQYQGEWVHQKMSWRPLWNRPNRHAKIAVRAQEQDQP